MSFPVHGLQAGSKRFGFHHHAFAAAKGPVIGHMMLIPGVIPDIMNADLNFPFGQGPADNPFLQGRGEKIGKNRQDRKNHRTRPALPVDLEQTRGQIKHDFRRLQGRYEFPHRRYKIFMIAVANNEHILGATQ